MKLPNFARLIYPALLLATVLWAMPLTGCSDSSDDEPGQTTPDNTGVSGESWDGDQTVSAKGETLTLTFTASADWTVNNPSTWLTVTPTKGKSGQNTITVTANSNSTDKERTATVLLRVSGSSKACSIKFVQPVNTQAATGVNGWMRQYMEECYLWNEPIADLDIKASLTPQKYLQAMLDGVDAFDHMNREDGHWANGKRQYYYSFLDSETARSRVGDEVTGSGVMYLSAMYMPGSNTNVGLMIYLVCPGSPAAQAGLRRGDVVSAINGTTITTSNYQSFVNSLVSGGITITWHRPNFSGNNVTLDDKGTLSLGSATFEDVAVYKSTVLELSGGKKVGYLLYNTFNYSYDQQLINVFSAFKAQGITDLILDLRYNGGGHVVSSLLMGTCIAGAQHKGKVYSRTIYNATRMQTESPGDYKFGISELPDMGGSYSKITDGLAQCVGLNTVYVLCTENTASASEMVINGLRGVDVNVRLIGLTTNGKNVGMEGIEEIFNGVKYGFYPITFRYQNAKEFSDFANGFTPDVEADEDEYVAGDFGTDDDIYTSLALEWIQTGNRPTLASASAATSRSGGRLRITSEMPASKRLQGALILPRKK